MNQIKNEILELMENACDSESKKIEVLNELILKIQVHLSRLYVMRKKSGYAAMILHKISENLSLNFIKKFWLKIAFVLMRVLREDIIFLCDIPDNTLEQIFCIVYNIERQLEDDEESKKIRDDITHVYDLAQSILDF